MSGLEKISIHAPLTGSEMLATSIQGTETISIHAPLTGSDDRAGAGNQRDGDFNPRSPYGERPPSGYRSTLCYRFSIHAPLTGSDDSLGQGIFVSQDFNPRSPYGERQAPSSRCTSLLFISIHAPLTGSDLVRHCRRDHRHKFQSTLPLRGATYCPPYR